jgi:hypothetical protein
MEKTWIVARMCDKELDAYPEVEERLPMLLENN